MFEREEDTEPSHIVYGALKGTNVTEGWRAIDDTIKKTVKQLLLRRYEPESMPDSDTFLDNFSKFAYVKVPIQQQAGEVYLWYEFLLKLSQEQGAFIDGDLCLSELFMSELPCVPKIQGLKTDVLQASLLALKYLHKKGNLGTVELVSRVIDTLEHWERKYLPANVQTGRLEIAEIVTGEPLKKFIGWLEWHKHQPEVKELKAESTKILRWFHTKNGVLTKNIDDNPFVTDGKAFNLKLKNALLDILGKIRADFATEKPTETKRKAKKTKTPKKTEKRFQPWTKSGDACFVIENNRIKFHYRGKFEDLRLKNDSRIHKLLFLFAAKNPLAQAKIREICTPRTRPSDIAKYANEKLNEKIVATGFADVPKSVEFIKYDKKHRCYGLWPKIQHREDFDRPE